MRVVVTKFKVFEGKVQNARLISANVHHGQAAWSTRELKFGLVEMIVVEVYIAEGVNKVA